MKAQTFSLTQLRYFHKVLKLNRCYSSCCQAQHHIRNFSPFCGKNLTFFLAKFLANKRVNLLPAWHWTQCITVTVGNLPSISSPPTCQMYQLLSEKMSFPICPFCHNQRHPRLLQSSHDVVNVLKWWEMGFITDSQKTDNIWPQSVVPQLDVESFASESE